MYKIDSSNGFCNFIGTTVNRSGREKDKEEGKCGSEEKDGSEYTPSLISPTTASTKGS